MKFTLTDFLELDTKTLLTVNGGASCSGGSCGYVVCSINKVQNSCEKYSQATILNGYKPENEYMGANNGASSGIIYDYYEITDTIPTQVPVNVTQHHHNSIPIISDSYMGNIYTAIICR